jgi:probable rRNA maturation factor
VLQVMGEPRVELTVTFVTALRMRGLNRKHLGRDYPTDVLSFGYEDELIDGIPFLGDIVIAPSIAFRHGRRWRAGLDREVRRLLVHGILHLLGYDHETDSGEMRRLQRRLQARRGLRQGEAVAEVKARV